MNKEQNTQNSEERAEIAPRRMCGIIMPIKPLDGLDPNHWNDVLTMLTDLAYEAGLDARIVSHHDASGTIHHTIVENLASDGLVICDVSTRNPNVMFELGMRLTFDKPTIVIIDDKSEFSYDTSPIGHEVYPRDLSTLNDSKFKERLLSKIKYTMEAAKDPEYSCFLKRYGDFEIPKLQVKHATLKEFIEASINRLSLEITALNPNQTPLRRIAPFPIRVSKALHDTFIKTLQEYLIKENLSVYHLLENPFEMKRMLINLDKIRWGGSRILSQDHITYLFNRFLVEGRLNGLN
jgi:hypothetical protein